MRIKIEIPSVKATIHNNDGALILSYELTGYNLEANAQGLVEAAVEIKAELERKLSESSVREELGNILAGTRSASDTPTE